MNPLASIPLKYRKYVLIAVLVILIIVIVAIASKTKDGGQDSGKDDTGNSIDMVGDDMASNSQPQSFPDGQYAIWADQLQDAMHDAGTDEEVIYSVFDQLNNDKDFQKLTAAFGMRKYTGHPIYNPFASKKSLAQWISSELDEDERDDLNQMFASKGITYRY